MTEISIVCCSKELEEDPAINEKWVCPRCGRVFAVVGRRSLCTVSGGEVHG